MHELSIAMSLIDVAEEQAAKLRSRVVAIHLRLGPLSGVVGSALLKAYETAREGTLLEDALLVIEEMPIVAYCEACQSSQRIPSMQDMSCPICRAPAMKVSGGRELELKGLEVESSETA